MDLHHAARAVHMVPPPAQSAFCVQLIWRAHVADKYVKRLRRLHPRWGDGSLRSVARLYPQAEDGGLPGALGASHMVVIAALVGRNFGS